MNKFLIKLINISAIISLCIFSTTLDNNIFAKANPRLPTTDSSYAKSIENETFPQKLIDSINKSSDIHINNKTTFKEFFELNNKKSKLNATRSLSPNNSTFEQGIDNAIQTLYPTNANSGAQNRIKLFGVERNRYEIILCAVNPWGCYVAAVITPEKATNFCNSYFNTDCNASSADGTRSNAIKHTYWNALMARDIGQYWAENFATSHEMYDINSGDNDIRRRSEMDMYNNQKGRELNYYYCHWNWSWGWYYKCENPSDQILQNRTTNLLWNGKLDVIFKRNF